MRSLSFFFGCLSGGLDGWLGNAKEKMSTTQREKRNKCLLPEEERTTTRTTSSATAAAPARNHGVLCFGWWISVTPPHGFSRGFCLMGGFGV